MMNAPKKNNKSTQHYTKRPSKLQAEQYWMFGIHACLAAIKNPNRLIQKVLVTENSYQHIEPADKQNFKALNIVNGNFFNSILPPGSLHQGIAVLTKTLRQDSLESIVFKNQGHMRVRILGLDKAQDSRNIGAIIRSAAAFDVDAIITPDKGSPEENANMARTAAGALEIVPFVRVKNFARALNFLKKNNFWITGLSQNGDQKLEEFSFSSKCALIVGSEGSGLRKLTLDSCDNHVKIDTTNRVESLNIAQATTIALYEMNRL